MLKGEGEIKFVVFRLALILTFSPKEKKQLTHIVGFVNDHPANFTGAKLDAAILSGAKLESAVLNGASLSLTRLDGAYLKNAEFKNANWWRARGLRTDQIEFLKQKYAPTADADPALKQDYTKWLGDAGGN